ARTGFGLVAASQVAQNVYLNGLEECFDMATSLGNARVSEPINAEASMPQRLTGKRGEVAAVVVDRDPKCTWGRSFDRTRHPGIRQILHAPASHVLGMPRQQRPFDSGDEVELGVGLVDDDLPAHAGPGPN